MSEPRRSFSRYLTVALFFCLTILFSSVLLLVDLLDRHELDRTLAHDVDRYGEMCPSQGNCQNALVRRSG